MWLALPAVVVGAVVWFFVPVWTIEAFKAQTSEGLNLSYLLHSWSPVVTLTALVLAALLLVTLWRGARLWLKVALVLLLVPVITVTWFARQDHSTAFAGSISVALYIRNTPIIASWMSPLLAMMGGA